VEFEYQRYGTQTMIVVLQVTAGTVWGWVGATRTEVDFARCIEAIVQCHTSYRRYHFVVDQLNTHKSEVLVRTTVKLCALDIDLGQKGQTGILRSIATRKAFLSQPD